MRLKLKHTEIAKKIISSILLILIGSIGSTHALAATPTPKPSAKLQPTTSSLSESLSNQINDLKERIASRVAQLKLVERRGVIGKATDITNTQITLSDVKDEIRFVDVDEITKFSSPSAKGSFGISDIPKGTTLAVLGLYNKESRRLLARFVNVVTPTVFIHGAVESVDSDDFVLKVQTEKGKPFTVDVEKTTKTFLYTKENGTVKSGFSKIIVGQRVSVVGYADLSDKNRIIAARVIVFPSLPRNPKIVFSTPLKLDAKESTASTGSGKKLTPLKP